MDPNIKVITLEGSDKKTSNHFKKILAQRGFNSFHYGNAKNKPSNTIRLNDDDYSKPTKTITDLIQTREAIDEKLRNYTEVDNNELELLPKNVHISYITYSVEKNMELFRMGGYLRKVAKDYIVLAGKGNKTFSVQRKVYSKDKKQLLYVTRFFAKKKNNASHLKLEGGGNISHHESIKKEYEEALTKSTSFMKKQQEILEAKQREIAELRARLEEEEQKKMKKDPLAPIKSIANRENSKIYSSDIESDNISIYSSKSNKSTVSNKSSKSTISK